jgi:hypothetical protein
MPCNIDAANISQPCFSSSYPLFSNFRAEACQTPKTKIVTKDMISNFALSLKIKNRIDKEIKRREVLKHHVSIIETPCCRTKLYVSRDET